MSRNYVVIAEDQTYSDFLSAQETRHIRFCTESRVQFHEMVNTYFREEDNLSEAALHERRTEVS